VLDAVAAGKQCGDDLDLIEGRPTGLVRASLGKDSTWEDVDHLVTFIHRTFVLAPADGARRGAQAEGARQRCAHGEGLGDNTAGATTTTTTFIATTTAIIPPPLPPPPSLPPPPPYLPLLPPQVNPKPKPNPNHHHYYHYYHHHSTI